MTRNPSRSRLVGMLPTAALAACAVALLAGPLATPAAAADLSGAWATDGSACDKLFEKTGKGIVFRTDSEVFGGGVIIDGTKIRGKAIACSIKARRVAGPVTHLLASCASDIMTSNVQFSVELPDPDTMVRVFPGMEGMELTYKRCRM
ncbi:hypothetical protein A33M_3844 [Rhodovulum sp. PH10]|uniref:hypothetical protein n=1 Tax=Rhodovulum sp. PH10 TaxID=1187851 RepID=UPI00027C2717|nr:hypothetical protein [Rhodovulum sp. PH10]EJW13424.1 hypothetical protein A33M_3844 [Rhodovulum sp. PH10]